MTETLYDVINDNFFSPRIVSALGYFVPIILFVFLSISIKAIDKKEKLLKKGFAVVIFIFFVLSVFNALMEVNDYANNSYVNQYENGYYEVVLGNVSKIEKTDDEIHFCVNGENFICISLNFNSRGYHTEDYEKNPFEESDVLKIYYVNIDESQESSYRDKVIMKIERT